MIKILILIPIIGITLNNIIKNINVKIKNKNNFYRFIGLFTTIIILWFIFFILLTFNFNNIEYQYRDIINLWIYNNINFGLDGINLSLLLLTSLIFPIIIYISTIENIKDKKLDIIEITNYILIIELFLIIIFTTLDIIIFYIMYELIIIPVFIIIGKKGSRINKIEATFRFIIYTIIGSLFLLLSILIFFIKYGSTNNELITLKLTYEYINNNLFLLKILWIFIFISFFIKFPIFPLHTWLPEAHVEAPTYGSIILAALLLKLGSFGLLKYSFSLFSPIYLPLFYLNKSIFLSKNIFLFYSPILYIFSIISILYSVILVIRLIDFKKIIAYSSIIHMNFSIFGFFSNNFIGLLGSSYLILSHAFISSALFFLIGILYIRYHTRIYLYYSNLYSFMPLFSLFFIFFIFSNSSLPLTSSFISELFILISSFSKNYFISFLLLFSLIFSSSFSFWLLNRLLYSYTSSYLFNYLDLSINEFILLLPLFFFTLFFGIYTSQLINLFTLPILNLLII